MIVSEAIDLVKEAELKQLAVRDNKPAIIGYINMGILEIHKRFVLWQAEAVVTMVDGTTLYKLDGVDPNVVIDLSEHDLLMIDEVYEETGELMSLNNEYDPYGAATPRFNHVEVVEPVDAGKLSIIYRATPKFLTHEKAEIPLPPQFFEPLFHYIGYRGHGSLKGDDKSENNTHYRRFERSCDRIKFEGLFTEDSLESTNFEVRGFV